jgi:flagellar hook assembly protein FlgD
MVAAPNPFTSLSSVTLWGVDGSSYMEVYDIAGRLVRDIPVPPDAVSHEAVTLTWDGRDSEGRVVPGGVYFYSISCGQDKRLWTKVVRMR